MKILITGTLGFIGSNFIRTVTRRYPEYQWVGVDKAVYNYNLDNSFEHLNYKFYLADIADQHTIERIFEIEKPDIVIGMAAESFVDNSITDIMPFLHTNVIGTQVLINASLKHKVNRYLHISTDEVYGQQLTKNNGGWTEDDPLNPRNPYAASKAAAELIVKTAHETHGLEYQMTRSCNVFGPRQKKDNLIPHIITNLKNGTPIKIHGNGQNFRQWIFVEDKINAIMRILLKGQPNEVYNIGAPKFTTNLEMVQEISKMLDIEPEIEFIADRKAHDFGYHVNAGKLRALGWEPWHSFNENLKRTIESYKENKKMLSKNQYNQAKDYLLGEFMDKLTILNKCGIK